MCMLSCFFATLWIVAHQDTWDGGVGLSMGFSRQEYWSGLLCPPPRDLSDSGIKSTSPESLALAGVFLPLVTPGKFRERYMY